MPVTMANIEIGENYDRDTLSILWGYKGRQAISRGIVTPSNDNKIILFVTRIKQKSDTQYNDYFIEEGLLHMEGETSHFNDQKLVNAEANGDVVYLFYRDIHHTPFTYYGEVFLVDYKIHSDRPSIFILSTSRSTTESDGSLSAEYNQIISIGENFIADSEGERRVGEHVRYKRSLMNRAKAIELHGAICKACGFNFNEFYGEELAGHFIEIHHMTPLSEIREGIIIDPSRDLVPLCSNCHSMIHRKRDTIMTVRELQEVIERNKRHK